MDKPLFWRQGTFERRNMVSLSDNIHDYEFISLLGKGGFGNVFEAQYKPTGYPVAIKKLDKDWLVTTHNVRRVRNEAEIHIQLKHPSILELYKYFEDDHSVYLILEQCKKGEMQKYLRSKKRFSESEARRFLEQLVHGVMYLHSKKIIHRDLKLTNVLLTEALDLKIADFGLAAKLKAYDEERDTMCGTPNYISPYDFFLAGSHYSEIIDGKPHGLATDIWSLGVILYTFLTGVPPFQAREKDVSATFERVRSGQYEIPPYISQMAADLLAGLLVKEPSQRLSLDGILQHPWMSWVDPTSHQETPLTLSSMLGPLCTKRLKPITHKTRHGVISISEEGRVIMQFVHSNSTQFIISADGREMQVVNLQNGSVAQFPFQEVPQKYWKVYKYASRFIDVITAKTPKVTFYSPECKAMLMENMTDFESQFYAGWKLHYSHNTKQWKGLEELPMDNESSKKIMEHATQCLKKCIEFEEIARRDTDDTSHKEDNFPLIISKRPSFSSSKSRPSSASDSHTPTTNTTHSSTFSLTTSSKSNSYSSLLNPNAIGSLSGSDYFPHNSTNSSNNNYLPPSISPIHSLSTAPSLSLQSINTSPSPSVLRQFLPGIGWAMQTESGEILTQCNDGTQIILSADSASIQYVDTKSRSSSFPLTLSDASLDPHLLTFAQRLNLVINFRNNYTTTQ